VSSDYLKLCLKHLKSDSINLLHSDIEELFYKYNEDVEDPQERKLRNRIKLDYLEKFESRDSEVEGLLIRATKIFESGSSEDVKFKENS
jgi:hypothetical protein